MDDILSAAREKGPGYAWLVLPFEITGETFISIQRLDRTSKSFLSQGKWQDDGAASVAAYEVAVSNSETTILLGPDTCNSISIDLDINVIASGNGVPGGRWESGEQLWPNIRPGGAGGEGPLRTSGAADPRPRVWPREGGVKPPIADKQGSEEADRPIETTTTASEVLTEQEIPAVPRPARGIRWGIVAGISGIITMTLLVAGGSYWGYRVWPEPWCSATGYFCLPTPMALPDGQVVPSDVQAIVQGGQERWVAAYSDPGAPLDRLMTLGLALRSQGDPQSREHGFEAIYAAAFRNHPPALMWLGEAYDPSLEGDVAGLGSQRNGLSALEYYTKATQAGAEAALSRKGHLCEWLKARQFSGDGAARQAFESGCRS